MLNYNALHSEITLDYHERSSLSSIRIFFSTVASIVAALVPLEIVKAFPDVHTGYIVMGLVFGAFFALPLIATIVVVKERIEFQRPLEAFNWRNAFIVPFQNRTFVYTLAMYLFAFVAIDTVSTIVVYFVRYYLLRSDEVSFVNGTLLIAQVISLPFYVALSKRTSKIRGYVIGLMMGRCHAVQFPAQSCRGFLGVCFRGGGWDRNRRHRGYDLRHLSRHPRCG
jgi:oligogalacturonide transporter